MLNFCQRAFVKKADKHKISDYLDINTRTPHQHDLMEIDYHLKIQGTLMDDLNEGVSLQKSAQVRLENLGQIKSRSTFINDPTRLECLRAIYELQRYLGRRDEIERLYDEERMEQQKAKLATKLPDGVKMVANNETGKRAFTKECATSILSSSSKRSISSLLPREHCSSYLALRRSSLFLSFMNVERLLICPRFSRRTCADFLSETHSLRSSIKVP